MKRFYQMEISRPDEEMARKQIVDYINNDIQEIYLYEYLSGIANTPREKSLIKEIIMDKERDIEIMKEVYEELGGKELQLEYEIMVDRPEKYFDALLLAYDLEELGIKLAVEIRKNMPNRYFRDRLFDIIIDEQKDLDITQLLIMLAIYGTIKS